MKKILIVLEILFLQITYCLGQANAVYLETGVYQLSPASKTTLDSVFLAIQKKQKLEQMALIGYADSDGSSKSKRSDKIICIFFLIDFNKFNRVV